MDFYEYEGRLIAVAEDGRGWALSNEDWRWRATSPDFAASMFARGNPLTEAEARRRFNFAQLPA